MIRLNMGSGLNPMPASEGWTNVDLYGEPDVRCDLERTPWSAWKPMPDGFKEYEEAKSWEDSSVDEMLWNHSLEHMGQDPKVFINIIKEIYRVCKPNAKITIAVPHHHHENFWNDPTHVRVITPELMALFSKRQCAEVKRLGGANSPLAIYHDVDFEVETVQNVLDPRYEYIVNRSDEQFRLSRQFLNVFVEVRMVLKVIK